MDPLMFGSRFDVDNDFRISMNMTSSSSDVDFPMRAWLLACYCFISFAGIMGNCLVLCVVSSNMRMKSSSFGVCLGSLALADLFVALSCLPVYVTSTSWFEAHPTGVAGDVMCKILSGYNILFFFATVSVYTLVIISLERYYAICNPLSSRALATPGLAKKIIAGVWIFSLVLGLLSIYGEQYADSKDASVGAHCKFSIAYRSKVAPKVVYVVIFSVQYILPVCCMVYCFLRIRSTLMLAIREVETKETRLQPGEILQVRQRKQTMVTVIIVVVAYFALWTPNQVLYFCFTFQLIHASWNSNQVQWSVVLCFSTCCVNPVIYAFRSKQFRDGFMSLLGWKKCARFFTEKRKFKRLPERGDAVSADQKL